MKFNNFNIKSSEGTFYQTSATPQEGFVAHTYTDRDTKKEVTNYHKSVDTLFGKLHSIKIKESKYGEQLCISLTTPEGDANVIQMRVFRSGTDVNDVVKSFVQVLENLVLGAQTEISLNKTAKDKSGRLYPNVYITQDGEKIPWAFKTIGEDSPVPRAKKVVNKVTKAETWDFDDVNAFYYETLKKVVNNVTMATPTDSPTNTEQPVNQDDIDDLPF